MSSHAATVRWHREGQELEGGGYRTAHAWEFDGGATVPASASPGVVGKRRSVAENVDPEEALVAAASSCHMLFYLHFAEDAGFPVRSYEDAADGTMAKTENGRIAITAITLRPKITYVDAVPDPATVEKLHHEAHEACFIASSLRTEITVAEPAD